MWDFSLELDCDRSAIAQTRGVRGHCVEHLEAELEGLQDAIHRKSVLRDERLDELDRRIELDQIARALSQDARKHGV